MRQFFVVEKMKNSKIFMYIILTLKGFIIKSTISSDLQPWERQTTGNTKKEKRMQCFNSYKQPSTMYRHTKLCQAGHLMLKEEIH